MQKRLLLVDRYTGSKLHDELAWRRWSIVDEERPARTRGRRQEQHAQQNGGENGADSFVYP
jgi:hypothetical protein